MFQTPRPLSFMSGADRIMIEKTVPKLILLDCDGVLYPTEQLPFRCFMTALQKTWDLLHVSPQTVQIAKEKRNTAGYTGIYNHILFVCRETQLDFNRVTDVFLQQVDYGGLKPNPTLKKQLEDLNRKIPCCIVTNNHKKHLNTVLNRVFGITSETNFLPQIDISDRFDGTGFLSKKNPTCFLKICRRFNVTPQQTLCADDTPAILKIAKRTGLKTLLVHQCLPLYPQIGACLAKLRQKD